MCDGEMSHGKIPGFLAFPRPSIRVKDALQAVCGYFPGATGEIL
jgi:hypothetical protein